MELRGECEGNYGKVRKGQFHFIHHFKFPTKLLLHLKALKMPYFSFLILLSRFKLQKKSFKLNKMTSITADDGSSADKNTDELVWFFAIDMDSVAKRPYSPNIELVIRPAKKVKFGKKKEVKKMASTLSVIFRTRYEMYYMVEGLRLPDGVDPNALQCYWRSSDQHLVIWAPCTKQTTANDVTGVALSYNGYGMERKEMDLMEQILNSNQHHLEHSAEKQRLEVRLANIPFMGSSHQNIVTFHHCNIGTEAVAFVSQILDSKEAEKLRADELKASLKLEKKMKKEKQFDGDGDYEKQYWFRNPVINFKHIEDKEEKEDEEDGEDDGKENVEEEVEGDDEEEQEDEEEEEEDDEEEKESDEDEDRETDDEEEKESDDNEEDDENEDDDEEDE